MAVTQDRLPGDSPYQRRRCRTMRSSLFGFAEQTTGHWRA